MQTLITLIILVVSIPVFAVGGMVMVLVSLGFPSQIYTTARIFSRIMLTCMGVIVRLRGKFPAKGQYIVMANHSSFIDPFLFPLVLRGKYTGIVADFNFKYPIWSLILKRFNAIRIVRDDREQALETIAHAERVIKKEGYHLAILPEGTRTVTGKLGAFKKGGFHMAVNTGVPILPVGINGAFRFKPKDRFAFNPGIVTVTIGKPIPADGLSVDELLEKVQQSIRELSGKTVPGDRH